MLAHFTLPYSPPFPSVGCLPCTSLLVRRALRQGAGSAGFQPASGQDGRSPRGWVLPDQRQPRVLEDRGLMRLGPIAAHADINAERNVERHHPFHALANQGLYPLKLRVRHLE